MKMKIRCGLLAILLFGSSLMANAGNGIKRSEWDFRPEITTGNVVYWLPAFAANLYLGYKLSKTNLNEDIDGTSLPWWYPQIGWRSAFATSVRIGGKSWYDVKENSLDWTDPGLSIGYAVNYTSKQVPFGFRFKIAYEHQNFKAKQNIKDEDRISFSKDMFVPEAALKILFGKYRTSERMFVLSLGARYDYAFSAKGYYDGKDAVNNGFSGIIGFEAAVPSAHIQMGGNFAIPFYKYFNEDFSPDGGMTHPYRDSKVDIWVAEVFMRFGF